MSQAPARQSNEQPVIALLGRRDEPTDALEDYCRYLANGLREHQIEMTLVRVAWEEQGWAAALRSLRNQASEWRGKWVLVQYTALSWSKRGFPNRVLRVLKALRESDTRIGIVFHDVEPYPGTRLIDKVRRRVQLNTIRAALRKVDLAVFTVALERISWLPKSFAKATFIPVGANLPIASEPKVVKTAASRVESSASDRPLTVAVFGITGGQAGTREAQLIIEAARHVSQRIGSFRLAVFGRYADFRETALREGLKGLPIELSVEGVLSDREIVERLCTSDVSLFLRGPISSRRGSAIAAIACGIPVVAFRGPETGPPMTGAGVAIVDEGDFIGLQNTLVRILADSQFRADLSREARDAYNRHFSWKAVAERYAKALRCC
jgi:glycosyltransferase involved in cell wall biosynthesis